MPSYDVNLDRDETYECGALLLTALAYPDGLEGESSQRLFISLCAKALRLAFAANPDDRTPITVKPQYVAVDSAIIERDFKFVGRRMEERLVAARVAWALLKSQGQPVLDLPDGIKSRTLSQLSEFVLDDAGLADPENFRKRYFRPSLPVIHLAAAASAASQSAGRQGNPAGLATLLTDRDYLAQVLNEAELIAELIERDPTFPIKAEKLVRLQRL